MSGRAVSTPSRSRAGRLWLLAALVAVAVGAALGYAIAYSRSLGGFAAIGAIFPMMGLGALVLLAVIIGAIGALSGARRRGLVVRGFGAAGLLLVGAALGMSSVPVLGLGYKAPVTLQSDGSITLILTGVAGFASAAESPARCSSAADTEAVAGVSGLELGELPEGTVRGGFSHDVESGLSAGGEVMIDLFVDGGDLSGGISQPFWSGPALMSEVDADGRGGSIVFTDIALQADPMGERGPAGGWPASLSGELLWRCGEWRPPGEHQ